VFLTVLLSKVFGLFLVIVGAAILLRRRYYLPVYGAYVRERLIRAVTSLAEILAGLFLVTLYGEWSSPSEAILGLIGWMALLEGLMFTLLPDGFLEKFMKIFNAPAWYVAGGLLAIATGSYLAASGFGLV
jgi:hypothetical protein